MKTGILVGAAVCLWAQALMGQWDFLSPGEMLALQLGDTLRIDESLAAELDADLALIFAAHPDVEPKYVMPNWEPFSILLKVTDEARDQYLDDGAIPDLEALNEQYGGNYTRTPGSRFMANWAFIKFDEPYNIPLLVPQYEALASVDHAEVNAMGGDSSTIVYFPDAELYAFRKAWGDCPSGCIYSAYRYFVVDDGGGVTEVTREEASELAGIQIIAAPTDMVVKAGEEIVAEVEHTWPEASTFYPIVRWQKYDREQMRWDHAYLGGERIAKPEDEGLYRGYAVDEWQSGVGAYTEPFYIQVDEADPVLWRKCYPMGEYWVWDWIGMFYGEHAPWIYVDGKGWFYSAGSDENATLWNEAGGWIWSSKEAYPWMWSYSEGEWFAGL